MLEPNLVRPVDISKNIGNPKKALDKLNWKPRFLLGEIVQNMIDAAISKIDDV